MSKINKIKENIINGTANLLNKIKDLEKQLKEKELENKLLKKQIDTNNNELNELSKFIDLQFNNKDDFVIPINNSPKGLHFNLTFPTSINTLALENKNNKLPDITEIDYDFDNIPPLVLEPQDQETTVLKKILIQNFGNNITSPLITSNKGTKK
jgi:hypothetical protein